MRSRFTIVVVVLTATVAALRGATPPPLESVIPQTVDFPGAAATAARGINNSRQIVGSYTCPKGGCLDPATGEVVNSAGTHGFLYDNGVYTTIDVSGSDFAGVTATIARGINDLGVIVGEYNVGTITHGFVRSVTDGRYTQVDVPAMYFDHPFEPQRNTLVVGISPEGELVGCFHETTDPMTVMMTMHGWRLRNGDWTVLLTPHDSSDTTSHDSDTMNNGVAPTGRITGYYFSEGVSYIADDGGVVTTFTFPDNRFTRAWSVNARGDIVGVHGDNAANGAVTAPVHPRGFLRNVHGQYRDVVVAGAAVTQMFGINDARDVVGSYTDSTNHVHGFTARLSNRGNQ